MAKLPLSPTYSNTISAISYTPTKPPKGDYVHSASHIFRVCKLLSIRTTTQSLTSDCGGINIIIRKLRLEEIRRLLRRQRFNQQCKCSISISHSLHQLLRRNISPRPRPPPKRPEPPPPLLLPRPPRQPRPWSALAFWTSTWVKTAE